MWGALAHSGPKNKVTGSKRLATGSVAHSLFSALYLMEPFFLTDDYFIRIRQAVWARYAELISDDRTYYSF